MKAKDYAQRFKDDPTDETLMEIAHDSFREVKEIGEMRHVQYDIGFLSILDEQDRKWRAFARMCPEINPLGFRTLVFKQFPFLVARWKPEKI